MKIPIVSQQGLKKWCQGHGVCMRDSAPDLGSLLLSNAPATEEKPIVANFIQERDIALVYAPQKVGKTHLADALAQSIAVGTELTPHFRVVESRSVAIFNGEMRAGQLQKRKRSTERQVGECAPGRPYCEFVMFGSQESDEAEDLTTKEGQQRFLELVDECNARHPESPKARVFILDSLKTLTNGGDVVAARWNALFRFLNKLRTDHPWTFIIIHHTNKLGEEAGTQDKAIKVDVRARLTRDAKTVLEDAGDYFPQLGENAQERLERQLALHFSGDRKDCIWFFFMLTDLRDLPKSAGRPFLMEMLPEDNPPRWKATELDDGGRLAETLAEADTPGSLSDALQPGAPSAKPRPTYEALKNADRETVVEAFRQVVGEEGRPLSRSQLGQRLGTGKDGVDYLMKKHGLRNEDIELGGGKPAEIR